MKYRITNIRMMGSMPISVSLAGRAAGGLGESGGDHCGVSERKVLMRQDLPATEARYFITADACRLDLPARSAFLEKLAAPRAESPAAMASRMPAISSR